MSAPIDPQALRRVAEKCQRAGDALDAIPIVRRVDEAADYLEAKILALLDDRDRLARRVEAAWPLAERMRARTRRESYPGTKMGDLIIHGTADAHDVGAPCERCDEIAAFDRERGEG